jgi:hypothetical protein
VSRRFIKLSFNNVFTEHESSFEFITEQDETPVVLVLQLVGASAATITITATLESVVENIDGTMTISNFYLGGTSRSVSMVSVSASAFQNRSTYTSNNSRFTLFAGVRYRLRFSSDSASLVESVRAVLVSTTKRRR